ncbi:hypothetical protein [Flavobacterium sp. '19STA2R22 D10 B1']|uniref:hypothetical protein n=1 Tax=Flavobacterium aerium TaxID=3037261 RepID=UPI00278C491E|nr:hypothetical protein [Flavobacterium sp. '19STA2R22 D10 B1']
MKKLIYLVLFASIILILFGCIYPEKTLIDIGVHDVYLLIGYQPIGALLLVLSIILCLIFFARRKKN